MKNLFRIFESGRNVIICWAIFLAWGIFLFQFGPFVTLRNFGQGLNLPEETFGFTYSYFYVFLYSLGEAGRSTYLNFQIFDYLNAILMGLAIFGAIFYLLNKLNVTGIFRLFLAFPVISTLLDVFENTSILYLLIQFPERVEALAQFVSFLTKAKMLFGGFAFVSLILCGVALLGSIIFRKVKKR